MRENILSKIKPTLFLLLILLAISSCKPTNAPVKTDSNNGNSNNKTNAPNGSNGAKNSDDPQAQIAARSAEINSQLAHQQQLKLQVNQLATIEKFTRDTTERQVIASLGLPDSSKVVTMDNQQQHMLFYNKQKFAVWLWPADANKPNDEVDSADNKTSNKAASKAVNKPAPTAVADNTAPAQYQYRATISTHDDGKLDLPLHNLFTEDELGRVREMMDKPQ